MSDAFDPKSRLPRREVLQLMAAGAASAALPAMGATKKAPTLMPAVFAAHGNPMFMDDALFMREFKDWAKALPKPKAVLMVSAHWESQPLTIGATKTVPLVYDFSNFPKRYYEVKYAAPGAPELAQRVRDLLRGAGMRTAEAPDRGLDHGAYVPMVCMYPEADVPVLQISLPSMDPQEVFEVGQALAPLRKEGVLLFGGGFLVHHFGLPRMIRADSSIIAKLREFDQWHEHVVSARDFDSLLDYRARAPWVQLAMQTPEHYVPLLFAAGASAERREAVTYPITGYMMDVFSKRSVQFG